MPPAVGLSVIRSSIHGYGLIATMDFAEGAIVTDVEGVLLGDNDPLEHAYVMWIEDAWYLEIVDQARWINHSCEPNVWIDGGMRQGVPWAHVIALRDIRAGEELTCDYAFASEAMEPCSCGAARCKGWIVDDEELARSAGGT